MALRSDTRAGELPKNAIKERVADIAAAFIGHFLPSESRSVGNSRIQDRAATVPVDLFLRIDSFLLALKE